MTAMNPHPTPPSAHDAPAHGHGASVAALAFAAIGIVFDDIGTSPLYTIQEQRSETGLKTTTGYMSDLTEFVRDLPCRNCGSMWSLAPYRDVDPK